MSKDHSGSFRIPVPDWLLNYRKDWLRPDIIAV